MMITVEIPADLTAWMDSLIEANRAQSVDKIGAAVAELDDALLSPRGRKAKSLYLKRLQNNYTSRAAVLRAAFNLVTDDVLRNRWVELSTQG